MIHGVEDKCSRLEADDICASVDDGVDSFILTNETSIGRNTAKSVEQLAKAIAEAENIFDYHRSFELLKESQGFKLGTVDTLLTTACTIALENNVDLILCITDNGKLARYLSKYRPEQPILACSTSSAVVRQVNMCKGVIGFKIP